MYSFLRQFFRNFNIVTTFSFGYDEDVARIVMERANFTYMVCPEADRKPVEKRFKGDENSDFVERFYYEDFTDLEFWLTYRKPRFDLAVIAAGDFYMKKWLLDYFVDLKTAYIVFADYDPSYKVTRDGYMFCEKLVGEMRVGVFYRDIVREEI